MIRPRIENQRLGHQNAGLVLMTLRQFVDEESYFYFLSSVDVNEPEVGWRYYDPPMRGRLRWVSYRYYVIWWRQRAVLFPISRSIARVVRGAATWRPHWNQSRLSFEVRSSLFVNSDEEMWRWWDYERRWSGYHRLFLAALKLVAAYLDRTDPHILLWLRSGQVGASSCRIRRVAKRPRVNTSGVSVGSGGSGSGLHSVFLNPLLRSESRLRPRRRSGMETRVKCLDAMLRVRATLLSRPPIFYWSAPPQADLVQQAREVPPEERTQGEQWVATMGGGVNVTEFAVTYTGNDFLVALSTGREMHAFLRVLRNPDALHEEFYDVERNLPPEDDPVTGEILNMGFQIRELLFWLQQQQQRQWGEANESPYPPLVLD